jgi:perosamine synthetase
MVVEADNRDKVMRYMLDHGIEVKPYFPTIHKQKCMPEYNGLSFPIAEEVASRTLALPYFTDMTEAEVDETCKVLKEALKV